MKNSFKLLILGLVLSVSTSMVSAQGGGRRGFDPEQFRERMMEGIKTQLKASDQEWTVIQPLVEKVMAKQRDSMGGRGGMFPGMRGGPPRDGGDRGTNQAQDRNRQPGRPGGDRTGPPPEVEALRAALESEKSTPADLKAKMAALRDSRKKNEAELQAAREELRKVLTLRQEAQLVLMGMLN